MFEAEQINNLDFSPEPERAEVSLSTARAIIGRAIIEGSDTTNMLMTSPGLRFIRHILSSTANRNILSIPNFSHIEVIQELVDLFIEKAGGAELALNKMYNLMQGSD